MLGLARVLVLGVLWVVVAAAPAAGQQRGSISGRVLDAGGLVLPGATITVTDQS
ncbi:MAG: carboxypeptidase regulatory-like domain-containing protein, partial [Acidobacteria bacterium]|nr:carboxypeptidase regulatory-like domain-containing protein [Acidobacteriota bacterium]